MEWEAIVNQNSNAKKHNKQHTRRKKYLHRAIASAAVAIAFLLATSCGLVQPVLGMPVMVVSLMIGCYNLGRAKGGATNVL